MNDNDSFILQSQFGIRKLDSMKGSPKSALFGKILIACSSLFFFIYLYMSFFSKWLPDSDIFLLDLIKYDHYFCYLLPLFIIPTYSVIYLNWLSISHFEQN